MKKRPLFGRRRRSRNAVRSLLRELPNLFKLVFRLMRDPRVPAASKALFGAVAIYMMVPLDLLPDFLGVLGWVDDMYLLGLALNRLLLSAGPAALLRHWDGNPAALGYLVEGVEEIGGSLPSRLRTTLAGLARDPSRLRVSRTRPIRRVERDEESRIRMEDQDIA